MFPRQTIQYHSNPSLYISTTNFKDAEVEWFYEDIQDLLELRLKNDVLCNTVNWNAKGGSQKIPGVTGKFGLGKKSRTKANRALPRGSTGHGKHPLPTTQGQL